MIKTVLRILQLSVFNTFNTHKKRSKKMARDNQRQQNRDRRPRSTNNEEELDQSPDFVYGFHAAMEVLEGDHDVNKVFLQTGLNEKNAQAILKAANKQNIMVSNVPKEKLDTLSDGGNHQGVVMAIAAYKYAELEDIFKKAEEANEDPIIMVLDGIEDPHNLGSILRTADASGVHGRSEEHTSELQSRF